MFLLNSSYIDKMGCYLYKHFFGEIEMTERRTRQDFLSFLDWMSEKGLMAKGTASARKAAASKVFGILSEDEAQDVTLLNVDDVMRRFTNLEGRSYTPGSLTTYLSRVRSALDDFKLYLDKPLNFRPGIQPRERRKQDAPREATSTTPIERRETEATSAPNALSIPIRPNMAVVIQGLPYDLNEVEAAKIANVIRAMVMPAT